LLSDFVLDDNNNYKIKRRILDLIEKWKKIKNRTIPTSKQIEKTLRQSKFKIIIREHIHYNVSISDFYKNRFKLSPNEVKKLRTIIGVNDHQESQILILAKKA
jgi:hypothetical protein